LNKKRIKPEIYNINVERQFLNETNIRLEGFICGLLAECIPDIPKNIKLVSVKSWHKYHGIKGDKTKNKKYVDDFIEIFIEDCKIFEAPLKEILIGNPNCYKHDMIDAYLISLYHN